MRKNRSVRFGFGVATVLLACSGYQVSCYTTVGGDVLLKDKLCVQIVDSGLVSAGLPC